MGTTMSGDFPQRVLPWLVQPPARPDAAIVGAQVQTLPLKKPGAFGFEGMQIFYSLLKVCLWCGLHALCVKWKRAWVFFSLNY